MSQQGFPPEAIPYPLLVQFEFHPDSTLAAQAAEYLHSVLNADPSVPGLQVPTTFTPVDGSGAPPEPRIAPEADRVMVVLLADDVLAANARCAGKNGRTWGDYVVALHSNCTASNRTRFMPVQLTEHAYPIDQRLENLSFLRAWASTDEIERKKLVARRLVHQLIRLVQSQGTDSDAPPVTIFLSHAKHDIDRKPCVARELVAHLSATQPEKPWFDSGDIASGSRFAQEIERGVNDAALLSILTDSYSSRSWCRREVLLAKRKQRPVVVVDALQEREVRRFPYAGNTPVLRWNGNAQEAIDLLLRETLRHTYAEAYLTHRKREGDVTLASGPELVTIVHLDKSRTVLYPDPPLGAEELAVLEATGIHVETPLERFARTNDLRTLNLTVALSVSEAEDLAKYGLRLMHLDAVLLEMSRYLLLAGIRLAYGGHLGSQGYTMRLADLLRDPVVEHLRGTRQGAQSPLPELVNYVAWPMPRDLSAEARLGPLVEIRRCQRPADVNETMDPSFVERPQADIPIDTAARRFALARGLTEMRTRQTAEIAARVIVGGRLGQSGNDYRGRLPGVLEEALLSIRAGKPVYLVGAFGGCARLVSDALAGVSRPELTWDYQRNVPDSDALPELYRKHGLVWEDYDAIVEQFRSCGINGLKNGLTPDENRELASTRSAERIVQLVLKGLQQMNPAPNAGASR